MRFRFSPRQHGVFLVYWLVILSLGGYLVWDAATDFRRQLHPILRSTIESCTWTAHRINELQVYDIQKQSDAFPTRQNDLLNRQTRTAWELAHICEDTIRKLQFEQFSRSRIQPAQAQHLALQIRQVGDSIQRYLPPDSLALLRLQQLIYKPASNLQSAEGLAFCRNAAPEQIALHLGDLRWKLELALYLLLPRIAERLHQYDYKEELLMPCLAIKDCPQVGKPFSGEIFLRAYSAHTENLECSIGRQKLPFRAGLAEYRTTFPHPGDYMRRVQIAVRNPLTGEIKIFMNEFPISVFEP